MAEQTTHTYISACGGARAISAPASAEDPSTAGIALPPSVDALDDLFAFIDDFCASEGLPKKARFDLTLMLEELFINIAKHGFPEGRPQHPVRLEARFDRQQGILHLTLMDAGIPYNPLVYQPELVEASKGSKNKIGGLGIFLVRELTDDIAYEHVGELNVLHLTKRIG